MLCHFANQFPAKVEVLLDATKGLKRGIREETITDLLIGGIIGCNPRRLSVNFSEEVDTGADMEWVFVDEATQQSLTLLIQAKKLYPSSKPDWENYYYRELFYHPRNAESPQATTLYECARSYGGSAFPLYFLYNGLSACKSARSKGASIVCGVNFISGVDVYRLEKLSRSYKKKIELKRLGNLRKKFYSLPDILCPESLKLSGPFALSHSNAMGPFFLFDKSVAFPVMPTPQVVLGRLQKTLLSETGARLEDCFPDLREAIILEKLAEDNFPLRLGDIPSHVRAIMDGNRPDVHHAKFTAIFHSSSD